MNISLLSDQDHAHLSTSHWSYSRINTYLTCPEKFRLHYIEGWRPQFPQANLIFGKAIHLALAQFFTDKTDPIQKFQESWLEVKEIDLEFSSRQSWNSLYERGQKMLECFMEQEVQHITKVEATEEAFELTISNLGLPFVGIIDLIAEYKGKRMVIDFKTSGSSYQGYEAALSDQLTAYHLAQPGISQGALCVLVKTKEPKIEWHCTMRSGDQMNEYLKKVESVAHLIDRKQFYKHSGNWCSYCDFLPICLGNSKQVAETLVQID